MAKPKGKMEDKWFKLAEFLRRRRFPLGAFGGGIAVLLFGDKSDSIYGIVFMVGGAIMLWLSRE